MAGDRLGVRGNRCARGIGSGMGVGFVSIIDMGEGVLIDDVTGEIIEGVVPGADPLFWAAIKLTDALEQEKAWRSEERRVGKECRL